MKINIVARTKLGVYTFQTRQPFLQQEIQQKIGVQGVGGMAQESGRKFGFETGDKGRNQGVHTVHGVKGPSPFFYINRGLFTKKGVVTKKKAKAIKGKKIGFVLRREEKESAEGLFKKKESGELWRGFQIVFWFERKERKA